MTTIKSHTDLEQSKKLAEILPAETADMWWAWYSSPFDTGHYDYFPMFHKPVCNSNESIPCWSLAALLSVINENFYPNIFHDGEAWNIEVTHHDNNDIKYAASANDIIDGVFEIILKLYESKTL